ncbi:MAG: hypothetical protein QNJ47_15970 [Nostocaceae cyanobacterium]|nr:hypothetical protein [Nostocaceae cyanobacterium]
MKQPITTRSYIPQPLVQIFTIFLLLLGSIGIVGGSFFFKQAFNGVSETKTIKNSDRYLEIRHQLWSSQELVKHFPKDIPTDATGVRLVYSPGVLQASNILQIKFKLPQKNIQKLLVQYRELAKHKYRGGDTNDHINLPNGVPTTFFYTSESAAQFFPPTYEILVLDAHDRGTAGFRWNHGDSYGVAIDSSTSEIVYWVEQW